MRLADSNWCKTLRASLPARRTADARRWGSLVLGAYDSEVSRLSSEVEGSQRDADAWAARCAQTEEKLTIAEANRDHWHSEANEANERVDLERQARLEERLESRREVERLTEALEKIATWHSSSIVGAKSIARAALAAGGRAAGDSA